MLHLLECTAPDQATIRAAGLAGGLAAAACRHSPLNLTASEHPPVTRPTHHALLQAAVPTHTLRSARHMSSPQCCDSCSGNSCSCG